MLFVAIDAFESSACGMKKVPLLFGKTEKNLPYLLYLLQIGLNLNMENNLTGIRSYDPKHEFWVGRCKD